MEKITVGQFLSFTNYYVPVYIEDEFMRYEGFGEGRTVSEMCNSLKNSEKLECPIDYIRNVDGGHFGDDEKKSNAIVIGIGIENWEKYFGKK